MSRPVQEEHRRGRFLVSTDPARLDLEAIHAYLSRSYWAAGRPREVIARSIEGSLCFGLYDGERQIGFARAITDRATFAYLADVYVLEDHRGQGLGVWLMECVFAHPDLQDLRRFTLVTRDAHDLYRKFGFEPLRQPEGYMERVAEAPAAGEPQNR
ncbi:MAG TPA: GNAT family N-acetyltransferase [Vicinamibacteria bacterium]